MLGIAEVYHVIEARFGLPRHGVGSP